MEKNNKIKLIFGLGNPGIKFENTPHNFGRDLIHYYFGEKIIDLPYSSLSKFKNLYLGIPKVYMNENGKALKEIIEKLKINTDKVLIVHDEADLDFLKVKISFNKGASMHKGVESIYNVCGKDIWRFRIGIQYLKTRVKAEKIILKKLPKRLILKWNKFKEKFAYVIEELSLKPIEKLNLPKDFYK